MQFNNYAWEDQDPEQMQDIVLSGGPNEDFPLEPSDSFSMDSFASKLPSGFDLVEALAPKDLQAIVSSMESDSRAALKLSDSVRLYADAAMKAWLWRDLVSMWSRSHIESQFVLKSWFQALGSRLNELKEIYPSLPDPNEKLSKIFQLLGNGLLSEKQFKSVAYMVAAARLEVADRSAHAKHRIESHPVWREAFKTEQVLPKTLADWNVKLAISKYKKSGSANSWAGELVNRFKYRSDAETVLKEEKAELVDQMARALSDFIEYKFSEIFVDKFTPPFDCCMGIPSNDSKRAALPSEVSKKLASLNSWLFDMSDCVSKTRTIKSVKSLPEAEKRAQLRGLYEVTPSKGYVPKLGILVFDDVYTSGATSDEIYRVLRMNYPKTPLYFISLTVTGPRGAML